MRVRNFRAVGVRQEELRLDSGLDFEPALRRLIDQPAENIPGRLRDRLALHHAVARDPCDFRFPGQLDDARRVGNRQHVRMGRRHVEMRCEPGEPGALLLHVGYDLGRDQLGSLHPEQIGE